MSQILISVIIPAYNAEAVLPRAVESALAQNLRPAEILIIDDGSQDSTLKIASSYGSPVRVLTKPNGGPASARNLGVQQARGDWVAFLDADDAWFPEKLERQTELIRPEVGVVCSPARGAPTLVRHVITFAELWERNFIVNSSALVRRAAFAQSGGLDEDPGLIGVEDYNLWLRLLAAGWTILSVPEELCIYTRLSSGLSRQTIRFASAALANIAKLARQLELDPRLVRLKEISTYDEFALDFFAQRDMKNARVFFTESLRRQFSFKQLGWLGLTYAPKRFLDWRRALLSRSANKGITGATIQNSK